MAIMVNEAAERLRRFIRGHAVYDEAGVLADLDAALAAERQRTVERIRERWEAHKITHASLMTDVGEVFYEIERLLLDSIATDENGGTP